MKTDQITRTKRLMPSLYLLLTLSLLLKCATCDFDLGSAAAGTIRKITCSAPSTNFDASLTALPDINGDSIADFAIGLPNYGNNQGGVAIIYGSADQNSNIEFCYGFYDTINGYIILGNALNSYFGSSVAYIGNINTDVPTLAVGAYPQSSGKGKVFFINLPSSPISSGFNVDLLTNPRTQQGSYYTYTGGAGYKLGQYLKAVGDVNGDGKPDVIASIEGYNTNNGAAVLLQGTTDFADQPVDAATPAYYLKMTGAGSSKIGSVFTRMGDLYGNGADAYALGSFADSTVFLLKGVLSTQISGSDVTMPYNGIRLTSSTYDIGQTLSSGKLDDDDYLDMIIGTKTKDAVIVLFGKWLKDLTQDASIDSLTSTQGFVITCATPNTQFGASVNAAIDVNADGFKDIIISASAAAGGKGYVYALYGGTSLGNNIEVTTMTSSQGTKYIGPTTSSALAASMDGNMDFNGNNGLPDLLLGSKSEGAYIVYTKCNDGSYASGPKCLTCNLNCATCTAATTCQTCATGFIPSNGFCCSSGSYFDGSSCKPCSRNCAACTSSTACQTCTTPFTLTNNYCCPAGQTYTSGSCVAGDSNSNPNSNLNSINAGSSSDSDNLSAGQLAGIAIGSILGGAALIGTLYLVFTKTTLGVKMLPQPLANALGVSKTANTAHMPIPPTPTKVIEEVSANQV